MTRFGLDRTYRHAMPDDSLILSHFVFNLEDDSSSVLFYDATNQASTTVLTTPQKVVKFLANCTAFGTDLGSSATRSIGLIHFQTPTFVFETGDVRIVSPFSSAFADDKLFHLEYLVALSWRLLDFSDTACQEAMVAWQKSACYETQSAQLTADDVAFCTALIQAFRFNMATE